MYLYWEHNLFSFSVSFSWDSFKLFSRDLSGPALFSAISSFMLQDWFNCFRIFITSLDFLFKEIMYLGINDSKALTNNSSVDFFRGVLERNSLKSSPSNSWRFRLKRKTLKYSFTGFSILKSSFNSWVSKSSMFVGIDGSLIEVSFWEISDW